MTSAAHHVRRDPLRAVAAKATVAAGRHRKAAFQLELLRGRIFETLSRRNSVTAATISNWRDVFLASGEAGLKSREADVEDEEKQRLKSVVAELAMSNELLRRRSGTWRRTALWHFGSRSHEPRPFAFHR